MDSIGSLRQKFVSDLSSIYDQDEALSLFQIAAEHLLGYSRIQLSMKLQEKLSEDQETNFNLLLQQLQTGRPIQQIIGKAPFYGMEFIVSEDTLIPRPETEELVQLIISENKRKSDLDIIDIGTGTGCIAISLKKGLEKSHVCAVDISPEAIAIAKENAQQNGCPVDFRCLDILEWNLVFDQEHYDIIVSNPPYITHDEKRDMHRNVLNFEPHTALFVEDSAPLLFYDHIASFALKHLKKEGTLYFEINQYLSEETKELLIKKGFAKVDILHDINSVPRMIRARYI
ncbi:peptide chain release factor N(5)-glutamine methyltransferase [Sphingobacterium sp. NPDC055431]